MQTHKRQWAEYDSGSERNKENIELSVMIQRQDGCRNRVFGDFKFFSSYEKMSDAEKVKFADSVYSAAKELSAKPLLEEKNIVDHLPPRRDQSGYIYVAKNHRNGLHKIGFSTNPSVREKTLQSEEPEISFVLVFKGTPQIEERLHLRFDSQRARGEWFNLSQSDIQIISSQEVAK